LRARAVDDRDFIPQEPTGNSERQHRENGEATERRKIPNTRCRAMEHDVR
jgi:hypothetical protein